MTSCHDEGANKVITNERSKSSLINKQTYNNILTIFKKILLDAALENTTTRHNQ